MKKIILSIATIIITFGAYAQTEITNRTMKKSDNKHYSDSENRNPPDGFMLQNGKLVMSKDGNITQVENDTTLNNGTVVMSDGHYMKKDEEKMKFKEGEHMDMSGKLTSTNSSRSSMTDSEGKNHPNGYLFKNGKLMKVNNGKMTALDGDVKLIDGTIIMKDGHYKKNDEEKIMFKEGEHMDMSGKIVQTNIDGQNSKQPSSDGPINNDY